MNNQTAGNSAINNNEGAPMITRETPIIKDGHGLNISKRLNLDYGTKFSTNPKDRAGNYSKCIRCCGNIPKYCCLPCAACECGPLTKIRTGQIGLLIEFGRLVKKLPPGLHTYNQCSQEVFPVNMKTQILDVPAQELITRDNVSLTVDAYLTFKVMVPELAKFKVSNYRSMLNSIAQGVLKNIVVERTLTELLSNRNEMEEQITKEIDEKTDFFGIKVILLELQGLNLPQDMIMAMSKVSIAELEAKAKIVVAQGNLNSSKIYGKAADLMRGNPVSLQLQYFETIKTIGDENNKTYIMPDKLIRLIQES